MQKIIQKKCTESTCRKTFSYKADDRYISCPYCGKSYPRLGNPKKVFCIVNGKKFDISWIRDYDVNHRLLAVKRLIVEHFNKEFSIGSFITISSEIVLYCLNQKVMPSKIFVKAELIKGEYTNKWVAKSITS